MQKADQRKKKYNNEMTSLRKFLNKNKIYFETIANPSLIATIVSLVALSFSWQANKIAGTNLQVFQEELDILISQTRPFLSVSNQYEFDNTQRVLGVEIEIQNSNSAFEGSNYKINIEEFLRLECQDTEKGDFWQVQVPIDGYYQQINLTGNSYGTIAVLIPGNSYDKMNLLYNSSINISPNYSGKAYPFFESFVYVEYETITHQTYTEIFQANPHSRSDRIEDMHDLLDYQISPNWPSVFFATPEPLFSSFIPTTFEDITPEDLFEWCNFDRVTP
jgi:hypothetical protein